MEKLQVKLKKVNKDLAVLLGRKNEMSLPQVSKIVINSGTGKAKDKKRNELVADRLAKITGQKVTERGAKQSVAGFKMREGDIVGLAVTLRGQRMYDFLDRFINIVIPRIRDFKGIDPKCIDEVGNMTIGIKEHTVFPETADEEIRDLFGLSVTIVTTARNKAEAKAFFDGIGFPFKKVK
ncbi:MAG: 50S ribosomal protein L5 [bacterium]